MLSTPVSWWKVCFCLLPTSALRASLCAAQSCGIANASYQTGRKICSARRLFCLILLWHGADERISYAREAHCITNLSLYLIYHGKRQRVIEWKQSTGWEKKMLWHVFTRREMHCLRLYHLKAFKITLMSHMILSWNITPVHCRETSGCLFITDTFTTGTSYLTNLDWNKNACCSEEENLLPLL